MTRLWIRLCLWLAGKLLHRHGYRVVRAQPFAAMVEEQMAAINYLQVSGALTTYHARRKVFHGMDRVLDAMDAAVNLSPTEATP